MKNKETSGDSKDKNSKNKKKDEETAKITSAPENAQLDENIDNKTDVEKPDDTSTTDTTEPGKETQVQETPPPIEPGGPGIPTKKSRRVDSISAFALIISVIVLILIIKIYPQVNNNIKDEADKIGAIENRLDQLNVNILQLDTQTKRTQLNIEIQKLEELLRSLDNLEDVSNPEIINLVKNVRNEVTSLLKALQEQE